MIAERAWDGKEGTRMHRGDVYTEAPGWALPRYMPD